MLRNLAVQYFQEVFDTGGSHDLEEVFESITEASEPVRSFLRQSCRNHMELNKFLMENSDSFIVENGQVAVRDPDLDRGREEALTHLKEQLDRYGYPVEIVNFKGHMAQASRAARDFIDLFYPGEDFKKFLESHTEAFVVFADETVILIEGECREFFEEILRESGCMHFNNLRARLARAKARVKEFMDLYYPGDLFIEFLNKHPIYFEIDEDIVRLA